MRSYFVSDVLVTLVQKELDKKYWSLFDKDGVFNNNSANEIKLNQSLMVGIMVKLPRQSMTKIAEAQDALLLNLKERYLVFFIYRIESMRS